MLEICIFSFKDREWESWREVGLKLDPETTLAKFTREPANLVKGICPSLLRGEEGDTANKNPCLSNI